jgi:hypothetical protein
MPTSLMLRRVALVRTDDLEERGTSIITVTRIDEIGTKLVVTNYAENSPLIIFTLIMETILSYESSVPTRATRRNIPEDGILYFQCSENPKSYVELTG